MIEPIRSASKRTLNFWRLLTGLFFNNLNELWTFDDEDDTLLGLVSWGLRKWLK